jgi:hypothetical protein
MQLVAIPAFMSAVAACMSYLVAKESMKASVIRDQCNIVAMRSIDGEKGVFFKITLNNRGPGLAIIDYLELKLGSIKIRCNNGSDLDKLAHEINFNTGQQYNYRVSEVGLPIQMPPNSDMVLLQIDKDWDASNFEEEKQRLKKFKELNDDLKVYVRYKDIHGNEKVLGNE